MSVARLAVHEDARVALKACEKGLHQYDLEMAPRGGTGSTCLRPANMRVAT